MINNDSVVAVFPIIQKKQPGMSIECDRIPEVACRFRNDNNIVGFCDEVIILGYIHRAEKSALEAIARSVLDAIKTDNTNYFNQLDGSFSIIAFCGGNLYVITDKLATRPLWYGIDQGKVIIANNVRSIYSRLSTKPDLDLAYLYSFVNYFRTVGAHSPFSSIIAVGPGQVLKITTDLQIRINVYWQPIFQPNMNRSLRDTAAEFSNVVKEAVEAKLTNSTKPALFLSGGLDSRLVAAHCPDHVMAVTLADSHNREMALAQMIAVACGLAHKPIYRKEDWYSGILRQACAISNGISRWDHAHFLPLQNIREEFDYDAVLLAFGFDTLFKGLNLSRFAQNPHVARRESLSEYIAAFPPLWGGAGKVLRKETADLAQRAFQGTVTCKCAEIEGHSDNLMDLHELFWIREFHTIPESLNLTCLRGFTSERNVTFTNAMLSFYLSIPTSQRNSQGALVREALKIASTKIASIPDANTWLPAGWNPHIHQMASQARAGIAKLRQSYLKLTNSKNCKSRGSWPHFGRMWVTNQEMTSEMDALLEAIDPRLERRLDIKYIRQEWCDMKAGKSSDSNVIDIIATIGLFLEICEK